MLYAEETSLISSIERAARRTQTKTAVPFPKGFIWQTYDRINDVETLSHLASSLKAAIGTYTVGKEQRHKVGYALSTICGGANS